MGLEESLGIEMEKVIIATGCREIVGGVNDGWGEDHIHANLLSEVLRLKQQDWFVGIEWCSRETNYTADMLAKEALGMSHGMLPFHNPSDFLREILESDMTM